MHKITLGKTGIPVSRIALGCMRMAGIGEADAHLLIRTAMEHGITFLITPTFMGAESQKDCLPKQQACRLLSVKK